VCGKDKLVRAETIVKAGMSYIEFYCAGCRQAWQVPERDDSSSPPEQGTVTIRDGDRSKDPGT
jgi:hypothetical protein